MSASMDGLLPIGVQIDGGLRRKFSIRLPKVNDTLLARDAFPSDDMRFMLVHIAGRLTFEGVTRPITHQDLVDLFDVDLEAIREADESLEKKRLPPKPG